MSSKLIKMIPVEWKKIIKNILYFFKKLIFFLILKIKTKIQTNYKIIIGAGGTNYSGWIPTDQISIDLLNNYSFSKFFKKNSISNILAEHVFEHLDFQQGVIAINNCYEYLKVGGSIRIAVPDGNFPNEDYIKHVKPNGTGLGAMDHKILYTYDTIIKLFDKKKFLINLIEYFEEDGEFIQNYNEEKNGYIMRSRNNDHRNTENTIKYTSIIVDAIKI